MNLLKLIVLSLFFSCTHAKDVPVNLTSHYVITHKKNLALFEKEIERLKNMESYQTNMAYHKRVEKAEKFRDSASQEFKELLEEQNLKNKKEFEQELRNYKTVWGYLVTNYRI